jgi:hypothetical protein
MVQWQQTISRGASVHLHNVGTTTTAMATFIERFQTSAEEVCVFYKNRILYQGCEL